MKQSIEHWLNAKSKLFSALGDGDEYTNREVVITHFAAITLLVASIIVGSLLN